MVKSRRIHLRPEELRYLLEAFHNKQGRSTIVGTPSPEIGLLRGMGLIEPREVSGGIPRTTPQGDVIVQRALQAINGTEVFFDGEANENARTDANPASRRGVYTELL